MKSGIQVPGVQEQFEVFFEAKVRVVRVHHKSPSRNLVGFDVVRNCGVDLVSEARTGRVRPVLNGFRPRPLRSSGVCDSCAWKCVSAKASD